MTLLSTFIPDNRTALLLCELFSQYRAGGDTREKLIALREQLGPEEFGNFESDLSRLMRKHRAHKAVELILRAALVRKRERLPGVSTRRIDRKAEQILQGESRIVLSIED